MSAEQRAQWEKKPKLRRILGWMAMGMVLLVALVACAGYWLTEPLDPEDMAALDQIHPVALNTSASSPATAHERSTSRGIEWPVEQLDGDEAKRLLLEVLLDDEARIDRVGGYTATFRKQERIRGTLRDEETLAIKVRHRPFAFYGKFIAPRPGKEVVYAEGHHGGKVIATGGGVSRLIIPRLALEPNSPLALADSRHPVTDAGLANLIHRLAKFRKLDLEDPDASTTLDRWTDSQGKLWFRSVHTHPQQNPERPFARVEVLYDCCSLFPMQITNFDWNVAKAGDTGVVGALAERYRYDDLEVDVPLTALDFDPANPNYAFHRF